MLKNKYLQVLRPTHWIKNIIIALPVVLSNQINFNESVDEFLNSCLITDFIVENYQSHPTIKIPLSN